MKRPAVPAMDEVDAILLDIDDMERTIFETQQAIRDLKDRLQGLPSQMVEQIDSINELVEAARYLYWMVPEILSNTIAHEMLGIKTYYLPITVGEAKTGVNCERCGCAMSFTSRAHQKRVTSSYAPREVLCPSCQEAIQRERLASSEQQLERVMTRFQELRTMPYREYLLTPEWQERRKRHLKSAGFRCQVCNAATPLDVHHRTYDRRGEEGYRDLIALCRTCHETFHKAGRLAG